MIAAQLVKSCDLSLGFFYDELEEPIDSFLLTPGGSLFPCAKQLGIMI
jgi:hypothetical protein